MREGAITALENAQTNDPGQPARDRVRMAEGEKIVDEDDRPKKVGSVLVDLGTFYYLGFNDLFDNLVCCEKRKSDS